jgi:hypothetical protein
MKTDQLAAALLRDRKRTSTLANPIVECFACGASFSYRGPNGDDSGRFCLIRCREAYDRGLSAYDPHYAGKSNPRWYNLPIGPNGFYINCLGCGNRFDSIGLRCCSSEYERRYRERQDTAALLAEVGMEAAAKRICEKPGCNSPIPKWRNGRRVSQRARFCDRHTRGLRKNGRRASACAR